LIFYPVGFFFAVSLFKDKKFNEDFLKSLLILFIFIGFIISLQVIGYHLLLTHGNRVISRQPNILLTSLIVSLSLLYFYKLNLIKKMALAGLSILYVLGIFLSMQRSLFVATTVAILVLTVFYIKIATKKTKTIITLIILVSIITSAMFIIAPNLSLNKNVSSRSSDALQEGFKTHSLQIRFLTYLHVYNEIKKNVLFGQGIGDTIVLPYLNQREISLVDNSYLVIIWKLGLVGFLIFASIYFLFIKKAIYIIQNSKTRLYIVISIVLLSSIIGQLVTGLACSIMSHYYFNFIWGALIGVVYYLYDEVRESAYERDLPTTS
jgi:cell division protein FtsW (lipid II flippase)